MINETCKYGCGKVSVFICADGKGRCAKSHNSCPANRAKNSNNLSLSYASGKRLSGRENYNKIPSNSKKSMAWRRGKLFADFSNGVNPTESHKKVLIEERGHECQRCRNTTWNDQPITLELEHIDADRLNNIRENLELLCPNCHSQTPTWRRGKNIRSGGKRYSDSEMIDAIKSSQNLNQVLVKLDLRYGSASTIINIMSKYNVSYSPV